MNECNNESTVLLIDRWVKRLLEVGAVVSAATAEGVKASLGGTCKGPPIRTNYP